MKSNVIAAQMRNDMIAVVITGFVFLAALFFSSILARRPIIIRSLAESGPPPDGPKGESPDRRVAGAATAPSTSSGLAVI